MTARRRTPAGEITRALHVCRDAITSGEFYTRWSLILSLIVCTLLTIPAVGAPSLEGYVRGAVVGFIGWIPLLIVGVTASVLERDITSRRGRAVIVVTSLVVFSTARPFINDALSRDIFGVATGGDFGQRIATNALTATAVLVLCAITAIHHRGTQSTTARLHDAVSRMRAGVAHADALAAETLPLLARTVAELRARRDRMLSNPLDYETVRAFADVVRSASHRLDAATAVPRPESFDAPVAPASRTPLLHRLTPTPPLVVGAAYGIVCAPFATGAGGVGVGILAFLGIALIDLAAGALTRLFRDAGPTVQGLAFLGAWAGAGVTALGYTFLLLPDVGSLGLVPLLGLPLSAVAVSLCVDAYRRARAEEQRATTVLAETAQELATAVERARMPLRRAADLLHGRIQGRCVMLAAYVDEDELTDELLARFIRETDDTFDEILAADRQPIGAGALTDLLTAWETIITTTADIDPEARGALDDPAVILPVVQLVNEALVNALKHSDTRSARVEVLMSADRHVYVRVASAGVLAEGAADGSGDGLGARAKHRRLLQVGDEVVLEGLLPTG